MRSSKYCNDLRNVNTNALSFDLAKPANQTRAKKSFSGYRALFSVALFAWIFSMVIDTSMFSYGIRHMTIVRIALISVMLICDLAYRQREYLRFRFLLRHLIVISLFIFCCYVSLSIKQYWLPQFLCIAYCSRNIEPGFLIKIWLYSILTGVGFVLISCALGLIPDYVVSAETRGVVGRHSLGFTYPTFLSHYFFGVVSSIIYLKRRSLSKLVFILLLIVDVAIFLFTDSRTACLLTAVLLMAYLLVLAGIVSPKKLSKGAKWGLRNSFMICFVVSAIMFLAVDMSDSVGKILNSMLSGRIAFTQQAMNTWPISLSGNDIHWSTHHLMEDGSVRTGYYDADRVFVPSNYLYVDCSYFNILLSDGLIVTAFLIVVLSLLSRAAVRNGDITLAVLLFLFAIKAIIDPQLLMVQYNPFLLFVAKPLFDESQIKQVGDSNRCITDSLQLREPSL